MNELTLKAIEYSDLVTRYRQEMEAGEEGRAK